MPSTRPSRTKAKTNGAQPLYADSDTDGDTEREQTPKPPARSMSKKRLSDVYHQDDGSFSLETNRAPLKSVNINDDAAEKRRRRKSAKVAVDAENAEAGPSEGRGEDGTSENSKAVAQARQKQQLLSIAQAPAVNVPLDVMSSNFEEWMKMATDNKINAANSWNFALIDYFHDMSLLRNNGDNSINFQRASCTLDGCVKIWTSRVDSVGTETGKLLSNLANEGRAEDEEDEEGHNSDNPDGDPSQTQRKRKAHRAGATLATNVAQLRSKKLDLEFSVDPLFKKTCADFDEGGAQGLLMSHLSLGVGPDGSLRVVFDASDSTGKAEDDEDPLEEPQDDVDLSYLRKHFLPDLEVLDEKAISHSLEGFSFVKDAFSFDATTFIHDDPLGIEADDDDDHGFDMPGDGGDQDGAPFMDVDGGGPPVEDFFVGDQAVGDEYAGGDFAGGGDIAPGEGGSEEPEGPPGAFVTFDPRRVPNERDLVLAMTEGESGMMMDYFDQTFLKNWAGPQHWKLRKVVRRPEASEAAPKVRREKKEAFKIDFLTPAEKSIKTIAKELFAPVTRGAGITLPGTSLSKTGSKRGKNKKGKEKDKRAEQTLPDDMHFSSKQLVTLFLKPKFSLHMRGQRARGDGEIDENFWAQAAANQAAGREGADGDETVDGGAIPFNTQFFHDEYDDAPGFDDVDDGVDGDLGVSVDPAEEDLLAATQGQTRRVRPEFVNYAKRAKRVDVRKLKENIWKGLDIKIPEEQGEDDMDVDDRPATDPSEARQFTSVISDLKQSYPKEKMAEISTSFCFICLLHLANEQGLKLEVGAEDTILAEDMEDQKVGNIWDLKVYRDPHATRSA